MIRKAYNKIANIVQKNVKFVFYLLYFEEKKTRKEV